MILINEKKVVAVICVTGKEKGKLQTLKVSRELFDGLEGGFV